MRYLSVCSGIEAASVAWGPLGWEPWAFSEVEAFPSAVLANHYPTTPNLGDLTKWKDWPDAAFDVLVGGTPCQSFSVAGLRKGLDDPRGGLLWAYLAVARRYRPRWVVWENVPGVLSIDGGRAFGTLLGGLEILGYGVAYRVLDAQYFRLAQRRRRVFVVGCLGGWSRAAAVLSERASLSGHSAPRRAPGEGVTGTLAARARSGGGLGTDLEIDGGLIPAVAPTLAGAANGGGANGPGRDVDSAESLIVMASGQANAEIRDDGGAPALTCLHEAPIIAHALRGEGFDASEDGTGRGMPLVPMAFDARQSDALIYGEKTGPLDTDGHSVGVLAFDAGQVTSPCHRRVPTDFAGALNGNARESVAFQTRGSNLSVGDVTGTLSVNGGSASGSAPMAAHGMTVRRLTPRECERLQGFPDDYTAIPYRGKPAADGPRYKALGNSMAVPVMRWIGRRIAEVDALGMENA